MKSLRLTTVVRDIRTATMTAQAFFRSPVMVGRQDSNALRLDAASVSRHHGAFLFSKRGLQYVDLHSANASFVDGVPIQPDKPIDIRNSSTITIGPFQIVPHVDLVSLAVPPSDPDANTTVLRDLARPTSSPAEPGRQAILANLDVIDQLLSRYTTASLLVRATDIVRVTADLIIRFRRSLDAPVSLLTTSTTRDELVAYLLEPDGEEERVEAFEALLTEMVRFPLTLVSGKGS